MNYLQYNNTLLVANSSTSFIPNATVSLYGTYEAEATRYTLPGVPTNLLYGRFDDTDDYAATAVQAGPSVATAGYTIHSPQAWIQGCHLLFVTFTQYSDGTPVTNGVYVDSPPTAAEDFITTATEAYPTYSGSVVTTMPSLFQSVILQALSTIAWDDITFAASSCTGSWGMGGEPTGKREKPDESRY